jgi:Fe-Mn family superoxide dismutase
MPHWTRRQLLQGAGAGVAGLALAPLTALAAQDKDKGSDKGHPRETPGFSLPPLPYAYDALEPHIDKETMRIHHDKHHQAYVTSLNATLKDHPKLLKLNIVQLLSSLDHVPKDLRQKVINFGGGHANHLMFWNIMGPKAGQPEGALAKAIDKNFGSFDKFQTQFSDAAKTLFGSGWAWLVLDNRGNLKIIQTHNQDSPYISGERPILGLDVWEHAYYLKYKNERPKYIEAWWHVVNWKEVGERYGAKS